MIKKICFALLSILVFSNVSYAQYSTLILPNHQKYIDSLKRMDYPHIFPILGKEAYKKGFDIPYPVGLMLNYFSMDQKINISNISLGVNDSELVDFTKFIEFGNIETKVNITTFRPDLWILPFLNIYGIFGYGNSSTKVELSNPVQFTTNPDFNGSSYGFGLTFAFGVGPAFVAIDQNWNWAHLKQLEKALPAQNFSFRIGHSFLFESRPDRNVALWFGGFRQRIEANTEGSVKLSEIFPSLPDEKKEQIVDKAKDWYEDLSPIDKAKVRVVYEAVSNYLDGKDLSDNRINYKLDKSPLKEWNMIFGAQYQHDKHWQLRTELGTFGARTQFLLSLNYRFLD